MTVTEVTTEEPTATENHKGSKERRPPVRIGCDFNLLPSSGEDSAMIYTDV